MRKRLLTAFVILVFAVSCAPIETVQPELPAVVEPEIDELKLPDITPEIDAEEKPEPVKTRVEKKADEQQYIMLNFENADIETVVSTIGEMLNINYILTPGVSGNITIQSHQKVPLNELFAVFQTILALNGFTAVKDGSFYKIVALETVKQQPVQVGSGKQPAIPKDASFVTHSIPLEYVNADDVANIVRNLMPRGTDIIVYEPANMLIITAPPTGLIKVFKILEIIDIPSTEKDTVRTFVYHVENSEAKKLAEILKKIYSDKKTTEKAQKVRSVTPTATPPAETAARRRVQPARQRVAPAPVQGLAATIEGEIIIEAYEDINALLIQATPRGYLALLETIKKLDIQPKQVLIEVLIAEITLDDTTKLGLEWLLRGEILDDKNIYNLIGGFADGGVAFDPTIEPSGGFISELPTGAFASIFDPLRFNVLISAAATTDKINVLASPHILGVDNQEAKIEIADEVPVATSISQPQDVTSNTISQVQFKSAGIILTVTPHINEKKQVKLKLTQEASQLGEKVPIAGEEFQGFRTRKVTTTAIVQDGHTLVLGGIISTRTQQTRSGVPFLSKIPILGYLFGTTTDEDERNELLLMVTPHVVGSHEEADLLTEEYESRVAELQRLTKKRAQRKKLGQLEYERERREEDVKEKQSDIHLHDSE
jgi:type II secretory pathway component GspD/PulD (secretin)